MKYRNIVTGIVIDMPCEVNSPDWVVVTDGPSAEVKAVNDIPDKSTRKRKK